MIQSTIISKAYFNYYIFNTLSLSNFHPPYHHILYYKYLYPTLHQTLSFRRTFPLPSYYVTFLQPYQGLEVPSIANRSTSAPLGSTLEIRCDVVDALDDISWTRAGLDVDDTLDIDGLSVSFTVCRL